MSKGLLFWVLMILWFLAAVFGVHLFGPHGVYVSTGLLLVLFGLLGWHCFGAPVK